MPALLATAYILVLAIMALGQAVLLVLQLRALGRYKHKSFAVLALGTGLGFLYSAVALLIVVAPSAVPKPNYVYLAVLLIAAIQIPIAVWGTAWLFRTYGQLHNYVGPLGRAELRL